MEGTIARNEPFVLKTGNENRGVAYFVDLIRSDQIWARLLSSTQHPLLVSVFTIQFSCFSCFFESFLPLNSLVSGEVGSHTVQ